MQVVMRVVMQVLMRATPRPMIAKSVDAGFKSATAVDTFGDHGGGRRAAGATRRPLTTHTV
jgi:hypothetical protein